MTSIVVSLALIIQPSVQVEHAPSAVPWMSREVSDASPVPPGGFYQGENLWNLSSIFDAPTTKTTSSPASSTAAIGTASSASPSDATSATPSPLPAPIGETLIPSDDALYRLRMCESTDRYAVNTGNGYFGAVQWLPATWNAAARGAGRLDLVGVRPDLVAPADQDAITRYWWNHSDPFTQWPVCARVAMRAA